MGASRLSVDTFPQNGLAPRASPRCGVTQAAAVLLYHYLYNWRSILLNFSQHPAPVLAAYYGPEDSGSNETLDFQLFLIDFIDIYCGSDLTNVSMLFT